MRNAISVALLAVSLGGCVTDQIAAVIQPQITVDGPKFPAAEFNCGQKPIPPDPATAGDHAASDAAYYENRLAVWGQRCANKLHSVGAALNAAGQITNGK
jgi:hypothetical protein